MFSLVSRSYVLDLTPGNSFIEHLTDAGFDVFMLDWGVPDERDANNLLEDYVAGYLPAAIDRTREITGCAEDQHARLLLRRRAGAALRRLATGRSASESFTVAATPVDFCQAGPLADLLREGRIEIDDVLDENGNVAASVVLNGFRTRSWSPRSPGTRTCGTSSRATSTSPATRRWAAGSNTQLSQARENDENRQIAFFVEILMRDRHRQDAIEVALAVSGFVTMLSDVPGEYPDLVVVERHAIFVFGEQHQVLGDLLVAVADMVQHE